MYIWNIYRCVTKTYVLMYSTTTALDPVCVYAYR